MRVTKFNSSHCPIVFPTRFLLPLSDIRFEFENRLFQLGYPIANFLSSFRDLEIEIGVDLLGKMGFDK